jgi:hypothetical protein
MDFFTPSITGWTYSITGFTLVLMRRVSVFGVFCLPKVLQNLPVLPAPRRAAACLPAALPLKPCRLPLFLPPACRFACPACRFHGLPYLPRCPQWPTKKP